MQFWCIDCPIHGTRLSNLNKTTLQTEFVDLMTSPSHAWTWQQATNYFLAAGNCYQKPFN